MGASLFSAAVAKQIQSDTSRYCVDRQQITQTKETQPQMTFSAVAKLVEAFWQELSQKGPDQVVRTQLSQYKERGVFPSVFIRNLNSLTEATIQLRENEKVQAQVPSLEERENLLHRLNDLWVDLRTPTASTNQSEKGLPPIPRWALRGGGLRSPESLPTASPDQPACVAPPIQLLVGGGVRSPESDPTAQKAAVSQKIVQVPETALYGGSSGRVSVSTAQTALPVTKVQIPEAFSGVQAPAKSTTGKLQIPKAFSGMQTSVPTSQPALSTTGKLRIPKAFGGVQASVPTSQPALSTTGKLRIPKAFGGVQASVPTPSTAPSVPGKVQIPAAFSGKWAPVQQTAAQGKAPAPEDMEWGGDQPPALPSAP